MQNTRTKNGNFLPTSNLINNQINTSINNQIFNMIFNQVINQANNHINNADIFAQMAIVNNTPILLQPAQAIQPAQVLQAVQAAPDNQMNFAERLAASRNDGTERGA